MSWLESIRKGSQERRERKQVAKLNSRNEQLRLVLLNHRVSLGQPRMIDLHFWAKGEKAAGRLEAALRSRGYEIAVKQPAVGEDPSGLWNVEVTVEQTPSLTLSEEFSREMVRLATEAGAIFDGWGTSV